MISATSMHEIILYAIDMHKNRLLTRAPFYEVFIFTSFSVISPIVNVLTFPSCLLPFGDLKALFFCSNVRFIASASHLGSEYMFWNLLALLNMETILCPWSRLIGPISWQVINNLQPTRSQLNHFYTFAD